MIPLKPAFANSATMYDSIYTERGKHYPAEAAYIAELDRSRRGEFGKTLLDVACGTGRHLHHFQEDFHYECAGIDRCPAMLDIARKRLPHMALHDMDMTSFSLGSEFHVVTCLFASIAYLADQTALRQAIACMARHVRKDGLLLIEPGVMPDTLRPSQLDELTVQCGETVVDRITTAKHHGDTLLIQFDFKMRSRGDVQRFREEHRIRLFDRSSFRRAFTDAGLVFGFDPLGPSGRGLFIGRPARS